MNLFKLHIAIVLFTNKIEYLTGKYVEFMTRVFVDIDHETSYYICIKGLFDIIQVDLIFDFIHEYYSGA